MLLRASKFATAKIECSFEMSKQTPLRVTIILLAMVQSIPYRVAAYITSKNQIERLLGKENAQVIV